MSGLREIKRRIKAVKSTSQVTRAMQLVAASKMKRAQHAAIGSRPFAQLLSQIFAALPAEVVASHPLLKPRPVKRRGVLIITPDKGLCGSLITNLNREILKLPPDAIYIAVGKRGANTLARTQRPMQAQFSLSDKTRFWELRPACDMLVAAYKAGQIDTIEVLFADYVSPVAQVPTLRCVLPVDNISKLVDSWPKKYTAVAPITQDNRPFIVEPSAETILAELVPFYIKQEIYHMALEAKASEHSARMVAMKNATDNAKSLGQELTLSYNKARQAAITQEILEIAAAGAVVN